MMKLFCFISVILIVISKFVWYDMETWKLIRISQALVQYTATLARDWFLRFQYSILELCCTAPTEFNSLKEGRGVRQNITEMETKQDYINKMT